MTSQRCPYGAGRRALLDAIAGGRVSCLAGLS